MLPLSLLYFSICYYEKCYLVARSLDGIYHFETLPVESVLFTIGFPTRVLSIPVLTLADFRQ